MFLTRNRASRAALTLVEMLMAMGIGSIVLLVLGSVTLYSARSFSSMANYSEINQMSRRALDEMTRDIRQSRGVVSFNNSSNSNELVFKKDFAGSNTFSLIHDKESGVLKHVSAGEERILSEDCTHFKATLFQRSPIANTFDFVQTTDPAKCKLVQLDYSFAKRTGASITNSETVESMKIVIRKRPD